MSIPGDLTTITVSFRFPAIGTPNAGSVKFEPSVPTLVDTVAPAFLVGSATSTLDATGLGSVTVPHSDNPNLSPAGTVWKVTENLIGRSARAPYFVNLPQSLGATADLEDLVHLDPPQTYSTYYGVLTQPNTWSGLNNFTGGLKVGGTLIVVPPGGTSKFLAADGTWQTPPSGSGSAVKVKRSYITAGAITFNADASFAAYPTIGGSIAASVGDDVELEVGGMWQKVGGDFIDWAVLVGGSPVRYSSTGNGTPGIEGDPGWYPDTGFPRGPGTFGFTATSGDIDTDGKVHFSLMHKGSAGGAWYSNANYPTRIKLTNNGPQS